MLYVPYAIALWLFLAGIIGIVRSRNLISAVPSLAVAQSSTYVLLVTIGYKRHAIAPIFSPSMPPSMRAVDPIVQALTLTDIVVATVVTALLLALAVQVYRTSGTLDPHDLQPMKK